jgi:hypothetical protein
MTPGTGANDYVSANYKSNCGLLGPNAVSPAVAHTLDAVVASSSGTVLELVNAIEINWALPYGIPNDRTQADITCKTEQNTAANAADADNHWLNDPLRIHQSSMIAKGFGAGNCFYLGVDGLF